MKRNDTGDFCLLYIEPADDRATVFQVISEQKKPVVILLPGQYKSRVFQHPEDFGTLKHVKRQLDVPIIFVTSGSERLTQIASRNGFPVYPSIDALSDAVSMGKLSLSRQRTLAKTGTLTPPEPCISTRKTVPLAHMQPGTAQSVNGTQVFKRKTVPLVPLQQQPAGRTVFPAPLQWDAVKSSSLPPLQQPGAKKQRRRFPALLIILTILVLGGAGLGSSLLLFHKYAPADVTVGQVLGHIYFLSSEQVSENSSQGIDDELQVDLHNLAAPDPGKSYYVWLLGDKSQGEARSIYLGQLAVNNGNVHFFYQGDQQHTNLLEITSRFLVTQEEAAATPITPSPDFSNWRYYAEFPQSPYTIDAHHYSYLDHVRHLLASDPMLNDMELPGGLNNWLYRNTGKLLEWTVSARDVWEEGKDMPFVRRQTARMLTYIDGLSFVRQDLPAASSSMALNSRLASVGLIDVNGASQNPPSYLNSIVVHLNGLIEAPGSTPEIRKDAAQIIAAMNNVQYWLQKLHDDARQIMALTDDQLQQPEALALLNDIVDQANHACVGQIDPTTNQARQGVIWIHDYMQFLATLEVKQYTSNNSSHQMIPDTKHQKAFLVTLEQGVARGLQGPLAGCGVSPLLSLIPPPKAAQNKRDLKSYHFSYLLGGR